jgi:hypothetical protein
MTEMSFACSIQGGSDRHKGASSPRGSCCSGYDRSTSILLALDHCNRLQSCDSSTDAKLVDHLNNL